MDYRTKAFNKLQPNGRRVERIYYHDELKMLPMELLVHITTIEW
jgi:hypothetical protein